MFQGAAALSLDAKGRLAIPARHREALVAASGGQLVLTAHPHRCLLLYPATAWEPIRDKVLSASSLNQQAAAIKRLLVGNAREEAMDSAGRLLVAPEPVAYTHLDVYKRQAWYELFANKALVDALLDRLQHRCITIRIDGPSLRTPEPPSPSQSQHRSKSA